MFREIEENPHNYGNLHCALSLSGGAVLALNRSFTSVLSGVHNMLASCSHEANDAYMEEFEKAWSEMRDLSIGRAGR